MGKGKQIRKEKIETENKIHINTNTMDDEDDEDILRIATESEETWNTWRSKRK